MKKFIFIMLLSFFLIASVSAFQLEKHLVQLEQDENYPCYVSDDTIICPAIDDAKIEDWKDKITNLKEEDKDKGKLKDNEKKAWLDSRVVPYEKPNQQRQIIITKEYREKINPYSLKDDEVIKIGFNTNVFGVSGTPLENFDVNSTTGLVSYRPLNMTWLNFGASYIILNSPNRPLDFMTKTNYSYFAWVNITSLQTRTSGDKSLHKNIFGYAGRMILGFNNETGFVQFSDYFIPISFFNNTINASTGLADSLWHFVGATRQDCNRTLYIDGVIVANNESMCAPLQQQATTIGGNDASSGYFSGSLDELRAYNRSLTSTEVLKLNASGRIRNDSLTNDGLGLWFSFNEGSSTTVNQYNISKGYSTQTKSSSITWQSDNINVTTLGYEVNITLHNITSALLFWDNYTLINYSESSNRTFTFLNNQSIYILENFKVNQTKTLQYSPIWFSFNNATEKHIASNLSGNINTSVILNATGINCNVVWNITYITNSSVITQWLNNNAKSVCTNLTTVGQILTIEPAASSNEILFGFDTTPPVITVISPVAKTYEATESITIDFSATDDIGMGSLWYTIDGSANKPYSVSVNENIDMALTSHLVTFYANDTSNNIATTSVTFYVTGGCTLGDRMGYNLILITSALAILVFIIAYVYRNGGIYSMNVNEMLIVFIGIIVGLVMLTAAGGNITSFCTPIG